MFIISKNKCQLSFGEDAAFDLLFTIARSPILEQILHTKISTNHNREIIIFICKNYSYMLKNRALSLEHCTLELEGAGDFIYRFRLEGRLFH